MSQGAERVTTRTTVSQLEESGLGTADRIFRQAFGTFLGLENPLEFMGDADYVRSRWRADPEAAFAAEVDGSIVGSNFVTRWGSVGFFGPLSVHPEFWGQGIARTLVQAAVDRLAEWNVTHAGLFTWAYSPMHLTLYQKFNFWPRFLTVIMEKTVSRAVVSNKSNSTEHSLKRYFDFSSNAKPDFIEECAALTDTIYTGLDVRREIYAVSDQGLGDTLVLEDTRGIVGFAICHYEAGSEAGSGACYIKFAAVRPGPDDADIFERLLAGCESLAREQNAVSLIAGVSTARREAYRTMLDRGFRIQRQGIAMHTSGEPGYHRGGIYVIDDWR